MMGLSIMKIHNFSGAVTDILAKTKKTLAAKSADIVEASALWSPMYGMGHPDNEKRIFVESKNNKTLIQFREQEHQSQHLEHYTIDTSASVFKNKKEDFWIL